MKSKLAVSTIIISGLIIALTVFMYKQYIYPIYLKNEKQEMTVDVSNSQKIVLKKVSKQDQIYSIEIELFGESKSNFSIVLTDSLGIPTQEIKLKRGSIDYMYQSDWYSSECHLQFLSKNKANNKVLLKGLKIEYRFLGLK